MTTKPRLLALAFASADLLIELDGEGRVVFALGAGPAGGIDPASAWTGKGLADALDAASRRALSAALTATGVGVRSGAVELLFDCGDGRVRKGQFRAFRLPQLAPAVSCAIGWEGAAFDRSVAETPPLLDAQGLLARVRDAYEGDRRQAATFSFIEVSGLAGEGPPHQRAAARIQALLQSASIDGESAARLSEDRFAVMRGANDTGDLADELREAAAAEGVTVDATVADAALGPDSDPATLIKALRFALEGCIKGGALGRPDLVFGETLKAVTEQAGRFRDLVRQRDFKLQYQPIVDLSTRAPHHYEALARLGGAAPEPAETIRMAEELGLIGAFDLAVAEKVLQKLRRPGLGLTRIALNVSGASLDNDTYAAGLLRLTGSDPDIRRRVLVEVTETAQIADLDAANRRLQSLRQAGIRVCLDDFGVGQASLEYLRRLQADIVKIDGAFVRDLATDDRSRSMIDHLVKLCAELGLTTIAECIETEEQAEAVRKLGVTHGQGWLFGRAADEPTYTPPVSSTARRKGVVEAWG